MRLYLTRQIVEAVFEALAKFDEADEQKPFLGVEIPNKIPKQNKVDQDNSKADEVCNLLLSNLQFQKDLLLRKAAELWSSTPT